MNFAKELKGNRGSSYIARTRPGQFSPSRLSALRVCELWGRKRTNISHECFQIGIIHGCRCAHLFELGEMDTNWPTNADSSFTLDWIYRQVVPRGRLLRRIVRMLM